MVVVEWEDAWASARWSPEHDQPESYEPYLVRTIGFVLWHNENGIQTAASVSDISPGSLHFTPAGMIRQIQVLDDE